MLYLHHFSLPTTAQPHAALIQGERLIALAELNALPCPPTAQALDASGLILAPGFIDLQLNGAFGLDFTADPATIWQVAAQLPRYGVTSFLPTIITAPLATYTQAQAVLHAGPPPGFKGAMPLGLHCEGPFLNPAKRGAHNPAHLRPPALADIITWSRAEHVALVTLAPEQPEALPLARTLIERGVIVSAGHSLASYEQSLAGFNTGIRYGTHLFNAMPPLEHRQPGLAGALLTDPRPIVGIIPDGQHVHPALLKMVWHSTGPTRLNVVTDAMAALGMAPGTYRLGDFDVTVDATTARLPNGRLAGSLLSLDAAVRNLQAFTGCPLADALATVTQVPAQLLGLTHLGHLTPGALADLVLLTPTGQVAHTFVRGQQVYMDKALVPG